MMWSSHPGGCGSTRLWEKLGKENLLSWGKQRGAGSWSLPRGIPGIRRNGESLHPKLAMNPVQDRESPGGKSASRALRGVRCALSWALQFPFFGGSREKLSLPTPALTRPFSGAALEGRAGRDFGGHINPKPLPEAGASPRGHGDCSWDRGPAVPGWAAPVGHSGLPPVLAQLGQRGWRSGQCPAEPRAGMGNWAW